MNTGNSRRIAALAILLAAAGMMPLAAQPFTIPAGDDGWVTGGSGGTKVDLSVFPLSGIFPRSCGSFTGPVVNLTSLPLDSTNLGSIDTIIHRTEDITLPSLGSRVGGKVQLVAISMKSESNVTLGSCTYNLKVFNSTFGSGASDSDKIYVTLDTADGGTFDSSFNVTPRLVFTPVSAPPGTVTIDCGAPPGGSCGTGLTLSTTSAEWARESGNPGGFSASSAGVTQIGANINVSGDGSGTTTYTTAGNSGNNFYGGFKHISPYAPKPSTHNHEVAVNFFHQGLAAQDCKPATKASPARSLAAQRVAVYCATATAQ